MKRFPVILLLGLSIVSLMALVSSAWLTDFTTAKSQEILTGTLELSLKAEDGQDSSFPGLINEDKNWIPGDHRETILTIQNYGNMDARWRLGIVPSGIKDKSLLDEIIVSYYYLNESGEWKLVKSERLKNLLVQADDNWLYDKDIFASGFNPLKPGQVQQLVMQVDFELSAMSPLQAKEFSGDLVLQGAQVTSENWFPFSRKPIRVGGLNNEN